MTLPNRLFYIHVVGKEWGALSQKIIHHFGDQVQWCVRGSLDAYFTNLRSSMTVTINFCDASEDIYGKYDFPIVLYSDEGASAGTTPHDQIIPKLQEFLDGEGIYKPVEKQND